MSSNNIKVCCRSVRTICMTVAIVRTLMPELISFRPPNALELREGGDIVVQVDNSSTNVKLKSQDAPKGAEADGYTFDRVFNPGTAQEEVFEYGVRGIVDGSLLLCFSLSCSSCADLMLSLRCHQWLQRCKPICNIAACCTKSSFLTATLLSRPSLPMVRPARVRPTP